jgi:hypothetical protein
MTKAVHRQLYPLGLVVFALVLAAYKASILSIGTADAWASWALFFGLDLFYLSFLLLAAMLFGFVKGSMLRIILWLPMVFLVVIYLIDSFVLLALDDHADLFDIGRYALEDGVVRSFFDATAYIAITSLLASLFIFSKFSSPIKKMSIAMFGIALVTGVITEAFAPKLMTRYAMLSPLNVLKSMGPQPTATDYSDEQIAFYSELPQTLTVIPESTPNIILVIVESLSSINSNRTSGVGNLLGGFDQLSEEGVLFRNFFANHQASEGGVIALLSGIPPMHFPTATPYMFDEFAILPSVIGEYQEQGYYTEFLTNSDLSFIGLNHYLEGVALDRSRGRDEIASMRDATRVVQDAPSDKLLYAEALSVLSQQTSSQSPHLMVLATTSTHLPYTHPEGGPDTAAAVWAWSSQQLSDFYLQLQVTGFFDDGILLITGDHRQMRRLTKQESEKYGGSARARVPLLVIGNEYPANTIDDRFFQQSDLLRMLGVLVQPQAILSAHPIWVERYNRKFGRIELIDNLSVFDQSDEGQYEYKLAITGNHIEWIGNTPEFATDIELQIHKQRSLHQGLRE